MSVVLALFILTVILFIYKLKYKERKPIFGVYVQAGKWYYLKYIIFACIYYYRKFTHKNSEGGVSGAGHGVKAINDAALMERTQPFSDDPKAFDAIFFTSAKSEGDKGVYILLGCERRPLGMVNGLVYIGIPGKGMLCSKKLPDTVLFGAQIDEFGAEGIKATPEVPMAKWNISYKGQMKYSHDPSKMVDVDLTGEWNATSQPFDYDTDLYPPAVISAIAREKWSREYFKTLRMAHQTHYEQFGTLKCKIKVDNQNFEYELRSFRDHSFGHKRDWSLMYRYGYHQIFLDNGINISAGVVSQPCTSSRLELGFIVFPNGEIEPIKSINLHLYQHGENGIAPKDYAFTFVAGDEEYHVQVLAEYETVHYVSSEWEARMCERFCKFIVNNVPGRGVSEFQYLNKDGRPESAAKDDPEWFRKMCHKI